MRIARLDLTRYGLFTDKSIELPQTDLDIHIVFGLNESGKTTSLAAIEDMLFGIPQRSPYSFLHKYRTLRMRIGGMLETDEESFEFQRRKTHKESILDSKGDPLYNGEGLIASFLGGSDRNFFERMFSLSHIRLAEGGRAILEAKDEVSRILFTAGTGLTHLQKRMSDLEQEADKLWAPRKATYRTYYKAKDKLDEAKSKQQEHTLRVESWEKLREELHDAESVRRERRNQYETLSKEQTKLARIRRVHGQIRRLQELNQDIEAMGEVRTLPENAAERLAQIREKDSTIQGQKNILSQQIDQIQKELKEISYDEAYVQRAEEIGHLLERHIELRNER